MAASRDLGAHALRLYLYLAANANGYTFALSPAAIQETIGMPRSTYHDQFRVLVSKGYLVHTGGNTFAFYEKPHPSAAQHHSNVMSGAGHDFEECPPTTFLHTNSEQNHTPSTAEINNIRILTDKLGINTGDENPNKIPIATVREIRIPSPSAMDKLPEKKKPFEDFEF